MSLDVMKVTVCFGSVRVVVPCGDGELLVSDLIEKATLRYKKAIGKPSDYWVAVHNLKSSSDGGILDPDDQLVDVADDREQIIAYFEEQGGPSLPHNGGDGTSASSVGTSSPDIFQGNDLHEPKPYVRLRENGKHDVIINDLSGVGSCLIVRRGSEPVLTTIGKDAPSSQQQQCVPIKSNKRWSAIASIDESKSPRGSDTSEQDDGTPPPPLTRVGGNGQDKERSAFSTFARDSTRRSLANNAAMLKWLDAQGKQQEKYEIRQQSRKEPLGGTDDVDNNTDHHANQSAESSPRTKDAKGSTGTVITLVNTGGPLGIHVVPHYEADGRDTGLMIQGIEPGGRVYRDGRLHVHDRIIEINGTSLLDVNFNTSQEIFKQALQKQDIKLRVIKEQAPPLPKLPPPVNRKLNQSSDLDLSQSTTSSPDSTRLDSVQTPVKGTVESPLTSTPTAPSSSEAKEPSRVEQQEPPPSPAKKIPPAVPVRHPNTALSSSIKNKILAPTNTRKIGQKIHIQLSKGADGLGFSITSRDNLSGGQVPIYIKNILNKGAAKEEGTLSPGDRLLEVNGIEMTGKNQSDAVNVLRNIKMGSVVNLVVSRQVVEEDKVEKEVKLVTPVGVEPAGGNDVTENTSDNKTNREILTLEIPLTESGSSGLGVSVKGKTATTPQGTTDLGIFIKAVISGGAASKDGRLRVNDQLMIVNNEPLFAKPNTDAMETLRKGMQKEGPTPGHIHLVIARRPIPCPASPKTSREMRVSRSEPPDKELASSDTESTSDAQQAPPGEEQVAAAKFRNPLLDRLTGGGSNALRNLSYQKANHDSILSSGGESVFPDDVTTPQRIKKERMASPTINGQSSETVLIEDDNSQVLMKRHHQQNAALKQRPASTLCFLRSAPNVPHSACKSTDDLAEGAAPDLPDWLVKECEKNNIDGDENVDDTIIVDGETVFQREGFGRQSMSEKRKGHIDPKLSEFYQKLKHTKDKGGQEYQSGEYSEGAGRLKRAGSAESLLSQSNQRGSLHETKPYSEDVGPTLGLKKSSSLESLQTAVQEVDQEEESKTAWKPPNKSMVRGRGCNESFRAAVDRSYDGAGSHDAMDTVEEESSESGSASQGQQSRGSSFSVTEGNALDAAKKNKKKIKKEKEKDKGGIFKGLFKFGKNRKVLDERVPQKSSSELRREVESDQLQEEAEKVKRAAQWEHDRLVQEQLRKYQDRQHKDAPKQPAPPPGKMSPPPATSRSERIHQLRAEHQRRHRERHGHYPHDDDEELLERQALEQEVKPGVEPADHQVPTGHRVHEPYDRPSSRIGYVDPARYSHYQNLQEIQEQLHRHDYYQHQYQQYMGRAPAGLPPPAAHSNPPPAAYEPRHTPSPDMYGYYRVHAVYDPRPAWAHPPSTGSGRSASPSRARSQTPVNQVAYYPHPHHNSQSLATNYGPPPVVSNAPAEHGQYPTRLYADYNKTRSAYSKEPSYNSLPRRREHRSSALYSSSSAQV